MTSQGNNPIEGDDFRIQSESITLNSGTYYFEDFSTQGNATLNINAASGPVIIYVTQSLQLDGVGGANPAGTPGDLIFLVTGNSVTVGKDAYSVIIAPSVQVSLGGNLDYYGAVVGSVVNGGNADYHYDEALSDLEIPGVSGGAIQVLLGG